MFFYNVMSMVKSLAIAILLLNYFSVNAQTNDLKGRIIDSLGSPLSKATITFSPKDGGKVRRTITNDLGYFSISKKESNSFKMIFSMLGYKNSLLDSKDIAKADSINITLYETSIIIDEISVISHPKHPILISKDTISYDLASFKGKDDKFLFETLSRIKGVRVNELGQVYAHGEKVTKITLNEEEIFNGDVGLLTRNLPIDLLETAEIINDYGKESEITGIKNNYTKSLNIQSKKPSLKGIFGELNLGLGTEKTYIANGTANYFDEKNQISLTAGTNNINKSNMLGASLMQSGSGTQLGQEGKNRVTNFSFNGRTKLNENSQLYINADQNNSLNKSFGEIRSTSIQQNSDIHYNEDFQRVSKDINRRFNLRYDFSNSRFSINISPFIKTTKGSYDEQRESIFFNDSDSLRNYSIIKDHSKNALGIDGSVHYKFNKPKRTIGFTIRTENEKNNEDQSIYNAYNRSIEPLSLTFYDIRNKNIFDPRLTYTEPLGKKGILEISYKHSQNIEKFNRNSYNENEKIVDSLSGVNDARTIHSHLNARVQYQHKKLIYDITFSYQNDYLKTKERDYSNKNISYKKLLPSLQLTYQFSTQRNIVFSAKQFYNLPSIYQIITIPTITDPLFVYTGNSDLNSENNKQINIGYKSMNPITGSIFRVNADYIITDNKITSNSSLLLDGEAQQYITLSNINGYKRFGIDYYYSKTISSTKVLDFIGRFNRDNNPQYINNTLNFGKNINVNQSVKLLWQLTKSISINPSVMYRLMNVQYGIEQTKIPSINTFNLLLDMSFSKGNFMTRISGNKFINTGFNSKSYNNFILNADLSYKILKGYCTINLEASDILNNNTGIRRNINNNTISDLSVNRLSRYIMLSLKYKIGNFK